MLFGVGDRSVLFAVRSVDPAHIEREEMSTSTALDEAKCGGPMDPTLPFVPVNNMILTIGGKNKLMTFTNLLNQQILAACSNLLQLQCKLNLSCQLFDADTLSIVGIVHGDYNTLLRAPPRQLFDNVLSEAGENGMTTFTDTLSQQISIACSAILELQCKINVSCQLFDSDTMSVVCIVLGDYGTLVKRTTTKYLFKTTAETTEKSWHTGTHSNGVKMD